MIKDIMKLSVLTITSVIAVSLALVILIVTAYTIISAIPVNPCSRYVEVREMASWRKLVGLTVEEIEEKFGNKNHMCTSKPYLCFYAGRDVRWFGTSYYNLHIFIEDGKVSRTKFVEEGPKGG
jgi:hypothetical protein